MATQVRATGMGRERLLDAAELLFASEGYEGARIRDIARLAGVEVGLTNYHFGSKDALYREVLVRRAPALADDLDRSLEAAQTEGTMNAILSAFARPHIERICDANTGWRNYLRLVAYTSLVHRSPELTDAAKHHYQPVLARYRAALMACAAHLQPEKIDRSFEAFRRAIMSICIDPGENSKRVHYYSTDDIRALIMTMVEIFAAGLAEAEAGESNSAKKR